MQLFGISVSGFLTNENNQVLLLKRAKGKHFLPGYFELPGGKMQHEESPRIALAREFKEETGLDIEIISPFATFSYFYDNIEYGRVKVVDIQYYVKAKRRGHTVALSDEHEDFAWTGQEDLKEYKITKESLEVIKKGFRGNKLENCKHQAPGAK